MSKDIYTTQRKLNKVLGISGYSMPDDELFDCSDYPNDGKFRGHFDRTGIKHSEESKKLMVLSGIKNKKSERMKGNTQGFTKGHTKSFSWAGKKLSAEHKKKISETMKKKKRIVV
tara:strand:+ start:133 stop:477 length:345 start_codon:yes stop_codon:yes gene_type:complete